MDDALASLSGISTANVVTPSIMPTSILFDKTTPSSVFQDPFTFESISPQLSSILQSYTFPTALSYTLSDYTITTQTTNTPLPAAASFYNTNGGIGVTNLPSSRLATTTASNIPTSLATMAGSTASAGTEAKPASYNPNSAPAKVTKNGALIFAFALTMIML